MKNVTPIALGITLAISGLAHAEDGYRQHDAHVHGQVEINIAQDGKELLMEITAPGADVVGFEHAPKTDEQKHQLEDAVAKLKQASNVFALAKGAGCQVEHQSVSHTLGGDEHDEHEGHDHHDDHKDHDHEHHDHDDHKGHDHHDDHKDHDHEHHDHDDHKGHDHHDDHKDHDHEHHDHEGHDHEGHEHEHGGHGEFTVEYHFECSDISKLNNIETQWFSHFPSTESIKVNVLTDTKQAALELHKGDTKIAL